MVLSLNEALQDPDVQEELRANPSSFRFRDEVEVVATMVKSWPHFRWEEAVDGEGEGREGGSFIITGAMANFFRILATSMNFTYRLMPPSDNAFGSRKEDGTWNGMVGLVSTGEADLGLGPLAITEPRWHVVAFSQPVFNTDLVILTSKGSLEIDPWAFLLPLTPALWVMLMATLVVVWAATLLVGRLGQVWRQWPHSVFLQLYGVLMQQGVTMPLCGQRLRLVVGGWVVASALVVWSYSGLLVSVMTVRHVPRPIQTAQDLIDASHVKVFTRSKTAYTDLMAQAESGVLHDLYGLRTQGRLIFNRVTLDEWLDLLRLGDRASLQTSLTATTLKAEDFNRRGQCELYIAKESLGSFTYSLITQKNSSILPAINIRVQAVLESGLYNYWVQQGFANGTACDSSPSTVTVHQPFSLASLWAVFAVLGVGLASGLLVFLLEVTVCRSAFCCKRRCGTIMRLSFG